MPRHRKAEAEFLEMPEIKRAMDLLLDDAQARNLDIEAFEASVLEVLLRAADKALSAQAAKAKELKSAEHQQSTPQPAARRGKSRRG